MKFLTFSRLVFFLNSHSAFILPISEWFFSYAREWFIKMKLLLNEKIWSDDHLFITNYVLLNDLKEKRVYNFAKICLRFVQNKIIDADARADVKPHRFLKFISLYLVRWAWKTNKNHGSCAKPRSTAEKRISLYFYQTHL